MLTLCLTQHADSQPDYHQVEVDLESDGLRQTAMAHFQFKLTQQEQENIRWYLEDYLQYLSDPAPQIAAKVETWMAEIGVKLFKAIFQANDDARNLWATLHQNLNHTHVKILTDIAQATTIPWELLRDPETDTCLALCSAAFVRSYSQPAQRPRLLQANGNTIRILLVICRPQGREDIPFRSVARRLIKGLGTRPDGFQLDVLRPPTFDQLSRVLRQAKAQSKPYHVVHFDGHGVFLDAIAETSGTSPDPRNIRGYLMFENPEYRKNQELINGKLLGEALVDSDVSLLVLNACRSAYAKVLEQPAQVNEGNSEQSNPEIQVRAFGSLAEEVMNAGVAGVVAMQYNVYVMTAAQFVADLYASLVQGQTLGEAVTSGRKQLKDQPQREIAYKSVALQDWLVPIVYEADAIALLPTHVHSQKLTIQLHENDVFPVTGMLDAQLPKAPDAGFFGRDETLLEIDRTFDHRSIILLHAFAGSGKTIAAAEFGRWYALTGGVLEAGQQGYVLFTSFQRYLPLSRVLDKFGQVFECDLERSGIHWLTLSDEQQRTVALQVLSQIPVLWIWDNVEPVAGFPDGETQCWSKAEQQELADFLRDARDTKAKFLLTSRRDEREWLGDLPVRVQVPPMPMQERVQFARELGKKYGYRLTDVEDWRPLLRYTQGNPLTITVVVGQLLHNGFRSKEQIENFISELQSGEAELDEDEGEGRSKSLSVSLSYGFTHTFNETERQQLALLHFFQGFVQLGTLQAMGDSSMAWCVPIVQGLTREQGLDLLNRAAEVGLLTCLVDGYYAVHPALPRHFKKIFDNYYSSVTTSAQNSPVRAFVEAISVLGDYYLRQYGNGSLDALWLLMAEEANFLSAYKLARTNGWRAALIGIIQGLQGLYEHTGRILEWAKLVEAIVPLFVNLKTDKPLIGREQDWSLITGYRVKLAMRRQEWDVVERLLKIKLKWDRAKVVNTITIPSQSLNEIQKNDILTLAVTLGQLGQYMSRQGKPDCVELYKEGVKLCQRLANYQEEAILAFNLGHAYKDIIALRNLEQAEHWYLCSLKLVDASDCLGKSRCLSQLGLIARERFKEALLNKQPSQVVHDYFNRSRQLYHQAISLSPSNAVSHLAVLHNVLSRIYADAGDFNQALSHSQEALRYYEKEINNNGAAKVRRDIAVILARANRLDDALLYAQAALNNFSNDRTVNTVEVQTTRQLISRIEQSLAYSRGN